MRDIGKNIRSLRIQKGMTQEQFAEKLFVTRQTVSNYETGKSRPDIEMVMQIAQVLETDANTVLYGIPVPPDKKREYRSLAAGAVIFLVLAVTTALLYPPLKELQQTRFLAAPLLLLRLVLIPALLFFFGWSAMQGLWILLDIRPFRKSWCGIVRRILLILTITGGLLLIPYGVFLGIALARQLMYDSVSMRFPVIPVYRQLSEFVLYLLLKCPAVAVIWGCLFRIFEIPGENE